MAIFRFAPSPNGYLHLGHAYSALISFRMAQRMGGQFLLRIEDIDKGRSREKFVSAIYQDLEWLGLRWPEPVLRQSEHIADYEQVGRQLAELGLTYPCFCTRKEISAATALSSGLDPDGMPIYAGRCRGLSKTEADKLKEDGRSFCMRLNMERARDHAVGVFGSDHLFFCELDAQGRTQDVLIDPMRWGDVVVQRKDVRTSYHLSVVIDDARQGVSHVVRGRDLYEATSIHRLLQLILYIQSPIYHHHDLVLDQSGAKLSKSNHATSIRSLRERGWSRADVLDRIGLEPD